MGCKEVIFNRKKKIIICLDFLFLNFREMKIGSLSQRLLNRLSCGQFHQHFGAKRKCEVLFHQQNYAQLHHYAQLENKLNF